MGDNITTRPLRAYMRGEAKNAKAEELLAFIKAEREVEEIENNEVPNTLRKRPLLPAIRAEEVSDNPRNHHVESIPPETLASLIQDIPVKNKSKFIWRDWDFKDDSCQTRNNRRLSSESCASISKDYLSNSGSSLEIAPKNLPPLRPRRMSKERYDRPGCPEPPRTPPFEINSHGK